ncbi:MAG: histidine kinase [Cyclobacteriaceae bacterium]|nr:histidine kinase [Cyclobacteriaceae bacterium]
MGLFFINRSLLRVVILVNFLFAMLLGQSQIIELSRPKAYQAVFVETDDFDSTYLTILYNALKLPLPDTTKFAIGNDLAYYWHTRDLDKAHQLADSIYRVTVSSNNPVWQGRLQTTLGAILLRQDRLDTAFTVLESARTKLPVKNWPHLYTQMGYVMERRGLLSKAADYALLGLHLGDSLNDIRAQAMAYSDLSNIFWKQSKFDKGVEYGVKSEKLYLKRGIHDMDFSFTLYVIGNNYVKKKNFIRALSYFNQALAISERYQFYNNLADIYISLCEVYTQTKEYPQAEGAARNAIRYSALLKNNFMRMRSWLELGKLQNLMGEPALAIASLEKCLTVATERFSDNYFLHRAYKELSHAYALMGDYKKANAAFLKYDQLKDSVFTAEADQRIATLQTEFEVKQKESTIKTQQQLISQQRRIQVLFIVGVGLLIVLILILLRTYRNKNKINNQLSALNESLGQKNMQLDKRNAENELLLKEIHHRVKNNLEIVSGLLSLQAAQLDHPSAQAVMLSSQNRVLSMGIIHQKLYQKDNLAAIEMKDYFQNLSESIIDSFNELDRITVQCNMPTIKLDVDTAVPIGLIANELLTNALKYAFGEKEAGEIQLRLVTTGQPNELLFQVRDNGIGKQNQGSIKGTGFGTELVDLLVRQLNGRLSIESGKGTTVNIYFNYYKSV